MSGIDLAGLATGLISDLGYGGLAAGLFLDSFGLPIPSEVLIPLATVLTIDGRFSLWAVFAVGTFAQMAGGLVGYYIGRYAGEPFLERYGKYVLISRRDLARTHRAFARYGPWLAMGGRCVPLIRGLIGYPAGVAKMNVWAFLGYTAIGSMAWTGLLVYLGVLAGRHIENVSKIMEPLSVIVLAAIVIAAAWHIRSVIQERRV